MVASDISETVLSGFAMSGLERRSGATVVRGAARGAEARVEGVASPGSPEEPVCLSGAAKSEV